MVAPPTTSEHPSSNTIGVLNATPGDLHTGTGFKRCEGKRKIRSDKGQHLSS